MPIAGVGIKPDGSLGWIDAQGNEVNPDGSPMQGAQQLRPLGAQQPTRPAPVAVASPTGNQGPAQPIVNTAPPAPAATTTTATAPAGPTATQTAQSAAAQAGQTTPSIGAPQGAGGMFTVDQATSQAAAEVQQANLNSAATWDAVSKAQQQLDYLTTDPTGKNEAIANPSLVTSATATLQSAYTSLSSAQQRVETANAAYSTSIQAAIKNNVVDPSQINLANSQSRQADAAADQAHANAQVLTDGAPGQRALVAAQAGQASASAAAQQASADAQNAKTPAEVQQLQAQAAGLNAQANQTNALLPGLIEKQKAETGLTVAQTGLTDSQSDYYKANAAKTNADADLTRVQTQTAQAALTAGAPQAGVQATLAQAAANQATAAATTAGVQQKLLGPTYGLQDQINAIKSIQQQVFGPGGSGDPTDADDLLKQFTTATIAGTTPFEAAKAAASQQGVNYGTQMAGVNALQGAQASRANAYAGLAGNALGTLEQMNAYAPKGSTAMAGAFGSVMQGMANALASQQFAPVQMPTPPPMPSFLQGFVSGHQAGQQTAAAQGQGQPNVNINIGGQGQPGSNAFSAGPGPMPAPPAAPAYATPPPIMNPPAGASNYSQQGQGLLGAQQQTPQQAFANGMASAPTYGMPNVLQSYGLNMPSPMAMLGRPYVGMGG